MDDFTIVKRMGIDLNGDLVEVFPYVKDSKHFDKGFGYIYKDKVYIYRGKLKKSKNEIIPGSMYLNDEKEPLWVPPAEDEAEEYSVNRVFPLTAEGIYEEMKSKENIKALNPVLLEQADNYFAPRINEGDDILKVIVKKALAVLKSAVKPVDGSGKDNKTMSEMINNLKSNLTKESNRLSILYFAKWMWILGLKCTIKVEFKGPDGEDVVIEEELRYNYNIH